MMAFKNHHFFILLMHTKNYLFASIATGALGFISLPVLTRLLSPGEYGTLNVFLSFVGLLTIILSLNAHTSVGRYWYEKQDDFSRFLGTSVFLVGMIMVLSCTGFAFFRKPLSKLLGLPGSLVLWLLPFIIVGIIDTIFQQIYQAQRRSALIAKLNIAKAYGGLGTGIFFVLMMGSERYYGVIWGRLIALALISVVVIKYLLPYFQFTFERSYLRYIAGYSIPLIPYVLSGPILGQFDRIMINSYIGSDAAGLYSLAYNIGMFPAIFISALLTAWIPDYFEDMDNKNYVKLDSDIDKMFRLILFGAMLFMLFGKEIGMVLAGEKYHSALKIVPVVVFGYIFTALWQFWGRNIGYARKTVWNSIVAVSAGFANIGLNIILIPRYGYVAGAYTTVASFMLMALMGWMVSKYVIHLHTTPMRIIVKPLCILLSVYALLIVIAQAGWGLWAMIGIKIVLFSMFCAAVVGRYIPGLFRSVTATEMQ